MSAVKPSEAALGVVLVVGVGLIGGSFALDVKQRGLAETVIGLGHRQATVDRAQALGLIDIATTDFNVAAAADLILLAVPVSRIGSLLAQFRPLLKPDVMIMDAGSTKANVVADAQHALGSLYPRFVGAHPMAGSERSGPDAAERGLFEGRQVLLTPTEQTDEWALARAREVWERLGSVVSVLEPHRHDQLLAEVSHLPHLVAFAAMDAILKSPIGQASLDHAGTGFRDFTRIAAAEPTLWADVLMENRSAVLSALDNLERELRRYRALLQDNHYDALRASITTASNARGAWCLGGSSATSESP